MTDSESCRAVTRSGLRCKNQPKASGFCNVHLPKTKKSDLVEHAKTVTQLAAAVGGVLGLVEKLVELWQSLPFGPGPEMPENYEYLADELGPSWGIEIDRFTPINLSGSSVDWSLVRYLHDAAIAFLQSPPSTQLDQARAFVSMDMAVSTLLESMPPELQLMLLKEVGRAE